MCVFALKELLRFYTQKDMVLPCIMHVAFLDDSKAFDRLNRRNLLPKLESRGVPTYMLRLLSIALIEQYTCVRRGSIHSECFVNVNGVKQGRILLLLFLTFTWTVLAHTFTCSP